MDFIDIIVHYLPKIILKLIIFHLQFGHEYFGFGLKCVGFGIGFEFTKKKNPPPPWFHVDFLQKFRGPVWHNPCKALAGNSWILKEKFISYALLFTLKYLVWAYLLDKQGQTLCSISQRLYYAYHGGKNFFPTSFLHSSLYFF